MEIEEKELTSQEIWALFKETAQSIKELRDQITRSERMFTSQWGKLIESLAESGIVQLLQKRGIKITELSSRVKKTFNGRQMELDFLLTNDTELVVGEVKTTLKAEDVSNFLEELDKFLEFFPKYRAYKIYGAVIGIRIDEDADRFAYHQGLFVFKVGGEGMLRLLNDEAFKPKDFSSQGSVKKKVISDQ